MKHTVESAQASVWLWIKSNLYPCPTRYCANNVSIPLAGQSVFLLKSSISWLCRVHSQGCHTLKAAWTWSWCASPSRADPTDTAPWSLVMHRGSPDLEQAAQAEKVSTFTESWKVLRAIKIWVCKLPEKEHSENPCHNHERLHQCYIMEICWDSFLFHFALSSPYHQHFPPTSNFALCGCFLCGYSIWHLYFIIFSSSKTSHSHINSFLSPLCPLFPSSPLARERCSFLCFLEGRAESGLVGAEHVLTAFREKGRKKETLLHRPLILLFSVLSFSSLYSKDQHKKIWINAEIFLGDRSTTPDMLNTIGFLHCSAPDLCEFFKPAATFWCHGNQIHYISGLSHRDKWVHGSNGHTITSHQFIPFSCSWLFLRYVT